MKTSWIYWVALALFTALAGSINKCAGLLNENERLSDNIGVLYSDIEYYRVNDSLSAAGIERLYVTQTELQRYNSDLAQQVEDLNIKLKRVEALSRSSIVTEYRVETVIKDSIIYIDGSTVDTLRCIDYKDRYLSFNGCENDGVGAYNIHSVDTIIQVVHRVPKKFLWFKFGCKAIRQEIVSKNPHSNIIYTEYIELK
jgi:hypothetical protein